MNGGPADTAADLQGRAARGAWWTLLHLLVSLPFGFVVNLVVARYLGVVDFGRGAMLTLAVDIASAVAGLGVNTALVQFGAKAHSAGRRDEVRSLLQAAQGFQALVQLPVVLLTVLVLGRWAGLPAEALAWVGIFGVVMPSLTSTGAACFGIENRGDLGARLALVGSVVGGLASIGVVLLSGSTGVLWATRLSVAGVLPVAALWLIAPGYRRAVLRPRFPHLPREFWRFALPAGLASLLGMAVSSRIEVFVLSWHSMSEAVGLYALAFGLVAHVFAPAQALIGPLQPAVAALREVSAETAQAAFERTLRATAVVAGLLVAGAVPVLAALIPTLYGSGYASAAPILVALGVVGGFSVLNGALGVFAQSRLDGRLVLRATAVALAADLGLALVLVPFWEAWGAVAATAAGTLVQFAVVAAAERAELGVGRAQVARLVAPLLLATPVAAVATWLSQVLGHPVLAALAAGFVGTVLWTLVTRLARVGLLGGDGRAMLGAMPARLRPAAGFLLGRLTRQDPSPQA